MNRLLHEDAAQALQDNLRELGIYFICNAGVRQIHGDQRVSGVRTRDGAEIKCDSVLLCTGIRPNLELARQAGIKVAQGIVVDDALRTSDPDVYAIGECCEHRGATYGLVGPGYEQAAVLARNLAARCLVADCVDAAAAVNDREQNEASSASTESGAPNEPAIESEQDLYTGSHALSRLKVLNESVCSMGQVVDLPRRPFQSVLDFKRRKAGLFRRVAVHRGKLIGFSGLGDWPEISRLQQAFVDEERVWPWQLLWFRLTGRLFWRLPRNDVSAWSDDTLVCQCNRLSKGVLTDAITSGCQTLASLQQKTRAGTVCGSCQPLLVDLVGGHSATPVAIQREQDAPIALGAGLIALCLLALFLVVPAFQVADSVQTRSWFEGIWNDGFYKQVTGFTLLGLSVIGLIMSLRKRLRWQWLGKFSAWRGVHTLIGALCLALLALHTGLHTGVNLNRWLLVDFLLVLGLGGLSALLVAYSHRLSPSRASAWRNALTRSHIYITWPLPVLLIMHVLSVYYF